MAVIWPRLLSTWTWVCQAQLRDNVARRRFALRWGRRARSCRDTLWFRSDAAAKKHSCLCFPCRSATRELWLKKVYSHTLQRRRKLSALLAVTAMSLVCVCKSWSKGAWQNQFQKKMGIPFWPLVFREASETNFLNKLVSPFHKNLLFLFLRNGQKLFLVQWLFFTNIMCRAPHGFSAQSSLFFTCTEIVLEICFETGDRSLCPPPQSLFRNPHAEMHITTLGWKWFAFCTCLWMVHHHHNQTPGLWTMKKFIREFVSRFTCDWSVHPRDDGVQVGESAFCKDMVLCVKKWHFWHRTACGGAKYACDALVHENETSE